MTKQLTFPVLRSATANILPACIIGEQHRAMAEPGSTRR